MVSERPLDLFLSRVEVVRRDGVWHRCKCPAHDDRQASLSISESPSGAVQFKCFAGCNKDDILREVGLTWPKMWPRQGKQRARSIKLNSRQELRPTRRYDYTDENGVKLFWVQRYEPKEFRQGMYTPNGLKVWGLTAGYYTSKRSELFKVKDGQENHCNKKNYPPDPELQAVWIPSPRTVLFRLPNVIWAKENGARLWITDGEKDVETLEKFGELATTRCKKLATWCKAWTQQLVSKSKPKDYEVIIVRDKDGAAKKFAGEKWAASVATALRAEGIPVRIVEAKVGKDATDHLDAGFSLEEFVPVDDWKAFEKPASAPEVTKVAEEENDDKASDGQTLHPNSVVPPIPLELPLPAKNPDGSLIEFEINDVGIAERLRHHFGSDLKYCKHFGCWLSWDGTGWTIDRAGGECVQDRIILVARGLLLESANCTDQARAKALSSAAHSYLSNVKIKAVEEIARRMPGFTVSPEDLDQHLDILPVANGTIDLSTGMLRPSYREDLCTKRLRISYDPMAECPVWMQFLDTVFAEDEEMLDYVWKALGYSLTGRTSEQNFFFLHGGGGNGKTKFIEAVMHVLGDFSTTTPAETLMVKKGDPGIPVDIADLKGARFVSCPETEEGKRLHESLIKQLTGGDTIKARFMRQNPFTFRPQFKLWMFGNHKPLIRNVDRGIWRRVHMIPFEVQIPEECEDKDLGDKLQAEAQGILTYMVLGCAQWRKSGLKPPGKVVEAVEDYRQDMDTIGQFFAEYCIEGSQEECPADRLFKRYERWAKDGGMHTFNSNTFGRMMTSRGIGRRKSMGKFVYLGVSLKQESIPTEEEWAPDA